MPPGNDGLGLGLLGISGDKLVDAATYEEIRKRTLASVRGTVQADILKEDQAQNTCIFSTEFAMQMMGDMQQFFIENGVRNYYSISISGYHIAEAGANPISQLAFTLANGFTIVEYYLARGMNIDDFAPNLSFFFSNGMDPEYTVIGRVARRIWARAMRERYGAGGAITDAQVSRANFRSQFCMHRKSASTIFEPHCRHCMPCLTTATACTRMHSMKPSRRPPNSPCVARLQSR